MKDLEYDGDDEWEDGTIYDSDSGKTYSCSMEIDKNGVLGIRGYIGFSLIGQTTEWTKCKQSKSILGKEIMKNLINSFIPVLAIFLLASCSGNQKNNERNPALPKIQKQQKI